MLKIVNKNRDSNDKKVGCFTTSFIIGKNLQIIKLNEEHIRNLKPKVVSEEFFTARKDCGSKYFLHVYIVNSKFEIVDKFNFTDTMEWWWMGKYQS